MHPIEPLGMHAKFWSLIEPLLQKKQFPEAVLFAGSKLANIPQFAYRLIAKLLCHDFRACGACNSCRAIIEGSHPDVHVIKLDEHDKNIKIDQIRALQQEIYQTPKWGTFSFIVMEAADKMNVFAANALLKILEEPPAHARFILIAEQVNQLLPTIISRCHKYLFPIETCLNSAIFDNCLQLGKLYPEASKESVIFKELSSFLNDLEDLMEERISPCKFAESWLKYSMEAVLWMLYLISAQLLYHQLVGAQDSEAMPWLGQLQRLSILIKPIDLFAQIDHINALVRKINHNVNINQTLALETLLLGYLRKLHE